ncbi:7095_t:CDS:2, partial [Paraglomus brasilianum]
MFKKIFPPKALFTPRRATIPRYASRHIPSSDHINISVGTLIALVCSVGGGTIAVARMIKEVMEGHKSFESRFDKVETRLNRLEDHVVGFAKENEYIKAMLENKSEGKPIEEKKNKPPFANLR